MKGIHKIKFTTASANYYVQGGLRKDLDSLKITLVIENPKLQHIKSRLRYDLYNDKEVERNAKEAAEKLNLRSDLLQMDISILTDLLEAERDKQLLQSPESIASNAMYRMNEESKKKCLDFLHKPGLIKNINALIGKAGVVGEETFDHLTGAAPRPAHVRSQVRPRRWRSDRRARSGPVRCGPVPSRARCRSGYETLSLKRCGVH